MTDPTVSVVVPVLNGDRWLETAILSIVQQDYPHLEVIIKDGGSTDNSAEIAARYLDKLLWISQPDTGIANAVNQGWARSSGEILGWIGSDDRLEAGAIRAAVDYMQAHPAVTAVYGDCTVIDGAGHLVYTIKPGPFDRPRLLGWNYIAQPATFMRRAVLAQVGWLDETLHNAMDHDLWIKLAIHGSMSYLPRTLASLRVHSATVTNRHVRRAGDETIRVVTRAFQDPTLPPDLQRMRPRALGEAYLRAGMCYYAVQEMAQARLLLKQAVRFWPRLAGDRRFLRTYGSTLLGRRIVTHLRQARRSVHT